MCSADRIPSPGQIQTQSSSRSASNTRRSEYDPLRTVHQLPSLLRELPEPLHWGLRRFPLFYGFLLECRNFLQRMVLRYKRRYDLYGIDLGSWHQVGPDGHLEPNTRTHACSADIENFVASHPWATMVDVELYRDAWVAGVKWVESSSDSCNKGPQSSSSMGTSGR